MQESVYFWIFRWKNSCGEVWNKDLFTYRDDRISHPDAPEPTSIAWLEEHKMEYHAYAT